MAHSISVEMPRMEIKNQDLCVVIRKNSVKIGELLISKGNLEFIPAGHSRNAKRFTWADLQYYMELYGRNVKRG